MSMSLWQSTPVTGSRAGPVAKFFRARFVTELFSAEPVPTQLWVEIRTSEIPINNQKLGRIAFSGSSHTGREKFSTGPVELRAGGDTRVAPNASGIPARRHRACLDHSTVFRNRSARYDG